MLLLLYLLPLWFSPIQPTLPKHQLPLFPCASVQFLLRYEVVQPLLPFKFVQVQVFHFRVLMITARPRNAVFLPMLQLFYLFTLWFLPTDQLPLVHCVAVPRQSTTTQPFLILPRQTEDYPFHPFLPEWTSPCLNVLFQPQFGVVQSLHPSTFKSDLFQI